MKPIVADTDDRRWQAVCERDTRADGQFVFAVLTTGICCRPSCPAPRARRGKGRVFWDGAPPRAGGLRPRQTGPPDKNNPPPPTVDK
ncbi:bifunctional transcriptional activator/DNA repair enzyme protein Ada, partial [Klebsiella pneumoniae subsp. pneumoniae]|uniref:Ada metal-binding domain-containing protein n=1 Tax=Klebsiella pneumoniae TaxID=573 RepID=UPI00113F7816